MSVLKEVAKPGAQGSILLREAAETMRLSRAVIIACCGLHDQSDKTNRIHFAEALPYRALAEDFRRHPAQVTTQ